MNHGNVSKEIAKGLLALQARIKAAKIPPSKLDETLNIATWNIREFGKQRRLEASIHYLAEILGQFDLITVVELRDNLEDMARVMQVLGPYWRLIYNDCIADPGGNRERVGFLYDKRAVTFNGFAAEADAPRRKVGEEYQTVQSFWRAPYAASFRAGNFDFVAVGLHVRWGESVTARRDEIQLFADWLEERHSDQFGEDKDLIVFGDFNIPKLDDALFKALTSHGLQIPPALRRLTAGDQVIGGTNLGADARYDQIAHYAKDPARFVRAGGTVDFYGGGKAIKELFPKGMDEDKFTYQMSDHLPLWIQINTDNDAQQLRQIIQG